MKNKCVDRQRMRDKQNGQIHNGNYSNQFCWCCCRCWDVLSYFNNMYKSTHVWVCINIAIDRNTLDFFLQFRVCTLFWHFRHWAFDFLILSVFFLLQIIIIFFRCWYSFISSSRWFLCAEWCFVSPPFIRSVHLFAISIFVLCIFILFIVFHLVPFGCIYSIDLPYRERSFSLSLCFPFLLGSQSLIYVHVFMLIHLLHVTFRHPHHNRPNTYTRIHILY